MGRPAKSRAGVHEMCLGVPGRVVGLVDGERGIATVDVGGERRAVNVALLPSEPIAGGWVLVHLGFAVEHIDAEEAAAMLEVPRLVEEALER